MQLQGEAFGELQSRDPPPCMLQVFLLLPPQPVFPHQARCHTPSRKPAPPLEPPPAILGHVQSHTPDHCCQSGRGPTTGSQKVDWSSANDPPCHCKQRHLYSSQAREKVLCAMFDSHALDPDSSVVFDVLVCVYCVVEDCPCNIGSVQGACCSKRSGALGSKQVNAHGWEAHDDAPAPCKS